LSELAGCRRRGCVCAEGGCCALAVRRGCPVGAGDAPVAAASTVRPHRRCCEAGGAGLVTRPASLGPPARMPLVGYL
jgi:hypothetical protein